MILTEDNYTKPHKDCPRPQMWTAADAHSTEVEVTALVAAFVRALQPEYVIETGTCFGQTAEAIGRALVENGHGRLVSLEVDPEKVASSRERCAGLPVDILEMSSLDYSPTRLIGFAFFDSLLNLREPELDRYAPWLQPGTVVGFHDTSPHMGPLGATLEARSDLSVIRLRTPRGVTFAEIL